MPSSYDVLLDAAIDHLQRLKAAGVRHVPVSSETLAALARPISRSSASRQVAVAGASLAPSRAAVRPPPPTALLTPKPEAAPAPVKSPAVISLDQSPALDAGNPPAIASTISPQERETRMSELRERALVCQKCPHLVVSRKNVVFGVGDIYSPLMFVGEAPGADEDAQGEPFVGAAGQLLTKIINAMGLTRETVYIANVLKCRPDTPGQTSGNRKPTGEEMKTCLPYLIEQIDLIQPKVMVALGGTAVLGLLGIEIGITKLRGNFQMLRGIPVMPTYHPSYLLRNQALAEKRNLWEDMLKVLEKLGRPITEKQRGYFLKPL